MPTSMNSIWHSLARARFPRADIQGDGPWCFLIRCYPNCGARLFTTEAEARTESGKSCGHAHCWLGHHSVFKLQEPKPPRHSLVWERDKY
jgi:hypothetical protein